MLGVDVRLVDQRAGVDGQALVDVEAADDKRAGMRTTSPPLLGPVAGSIFVIEGIATI